MSLPVLEEASANGKIRGSLTHPKPLAEPSIHDDVFFRTERDSMGELSVPADALWGAQTQRAVQNFPISGLTMPRGFISAIGLVKQAAARANTRLDLLKSDVRAGAVDAAAAEVTANKHDAHFPIDVFRPVRAPART